MIIARMVKNLVEYGEFSFNLGQRVSSSTSPIFGLLSAAIATTGVSPLSSAKILGTIASSITAVLIFKILYEYTADKTKNNNQWLVITSIAGSMIYILLPPVIAYSVSGLETAFYALLCAVSLERLMHLDEKTARMTSIWFATFAALFRPDGLITLGFVGTVLLWHGRKNLWKAVLEFWPAFLLIPLYLIIHQIYFGSPVPQSLLAKASSYKINIPRNASRYLDRMLFAQQGSILFYVLSLVGVAWSAKKAKQLLLFISWYLVYHLFFILRAPLFDWYLQVPLFVLCLFSALGLFTLVELSINLIRLPGWAPFLKALAGFGIGMILLVAMIPYVKNRQAGQMWELSVRAAAGQWLTDNSKIDDLVFTESLGFIGYYSHNDFVDWPGLASPEVPNLLENNGVQKDRIKSFDTIISNYKPSYLVLRTHEYDTLASNLKSQYGICERFSYPANETKNGYLIASVTCPW